VPERQFVCRLHVQSHTPPRLNAGLSNQLTGVVREPFSDEEMGALNKRRTGSKTGIRPVLLPLRDVARALHRGGVKQIVTPLLDFLLGSARSTLTFGGPFCTALHALSVPRISLIVCSAALPFLLFCARAGHVCARVDYQ
jgi:hypothetical protein